MDIASLNISLVRQEPKSDDCLRCCAQMIFSYFKDPISKDEIWKKLHVYKKHSGLNEAISRTSEKSLLKEIIKLKFTTATGTGGIKMWLLHLLKIKNPY